MKLRKTLYKAVGLVSLLPMLLLVSCTGNDDKPFAWDGKWQRTITVPSGIQGRCVDENLSITRKDWNLRVVVHSTFHCDQPILELAFNGVIQEVKIKRDSNDRDIRFQVSKIHLEEMIDVAGERRTILSKSVIAGLSEKYVPEKYEAFEQKAYMSADGKSMESLIYQPILALAIPLYPAETQPPAYERVE